MTSISSSGPTRHLCQPSEGASGDCDGTTTTANAVTNTPLHLQLLSRSRSRCVYVKSKKVRGDAARVEGRMERGRIGRAGGLDVSRPHVIPSYSTLSVRRTNFCCTENIRALLHDFAPVKNRYYPRVLRDDVPSTGLPLEFSDNFFSPIALSDDLRTLFLLDHLIIHSFFLASIINHT